MCSSPRLIAACHVLHRLLMPRHSPCALISLTFVGANSISLASVFDESSLISLRLLFLANPLALGFARMRVDSIYLLGSLRIMQASVWFHCSFCYPLIVIIKSPQKFVLCYLSVACSQFLALHLLFSFQGAGFPTSFKVRMKHSIA